MADSENNIDDLKIRLTASLADANSKIAELEEKKKQLIEALNWNQEYFEKSEAIKVKFSDFEKALSEANVKAILLQVNNDASDVATKKGNVLDISKQATDGKVEIEKIIGEISGLQKNGKDLLAAMDLIKKQVDSQSENVGKVSSLATDAAATLQSVKTDVADWKANSQVALSDFSTNTKAQLDQISKEIDVNTKKAEGLLGLTTSASLATAFRNKKKEMVNTAWFWNITFIASLVAMASLAIFYHDKQIDDAIIRYGYLISLLLKLPFLAPLFWLAYFAQGRSGLYSRLADDYGYKESISIAFEGYKKQIWEMVAADKTKNPDPKEVLVTHTLNAINNDPERIHGVYKPPKVPLQEIIENSFKSDSAKPESFKTVEIPELGSFKKWLYAIGGSSVLAIIAIIWLAVKFFNSIASPAH